MVLQPIQGGMLMSATSLPMDVNAAKRLPWLRSRNWDLSFISLSVILVALPYVLYLVLLRLGTALTPVADFLGGNVDSISRNTVNFGVALLIGGPHMYVTQYRISLNRDFVSQHRRYVVSALIVPVVVITLAFLNLTVLLTVFFFWASIHVLHQIIFVTGLYNEKRATRLTLFSRLSDYAVILTALYPLAAWKVVTGRFLIGTHDLGATVGQYVPVGPWMVWLVGGAFAIALVVWVGKSVVEWRQGTLHGPKTLFLAVTISVSFMVPALGNLDTAFQGMNVWHSFQYLFLTWLLINLAQQRGQLHNSPFVASVAKSGASRRYYGFAIAATLGTVLVAGLLFTLFRFGMGQTFDLAFDRAYYIAVLSILWMHYYFDHYLFSKPQAIVK
jgi:hypothetical protein